MLMGGLNRKDRDIKNTEDMADRNFDFASGRHLLPRLCGVTRTHAMEPEKRISTYTTLAIGREF